MRIRTSLALVALLAGIAGAMPSADRMLFFDQGDTGSIVISTAPTTPTQIFSNSAAALKTSLTTNSTNAIFIVGGSSTAANPMSTFSTFSISLTTGSYYVPPQNSTITFTTVSFDGVVPFQGPLWAVAQGTGGTFIIRQRVK